MIRRVKKVVFLLVITSGVRIASKFSNPFDLFLDQDHCKRKYCTSYQGTHIQNRSCASKQLTLRIAEWALKLETCVVMFIYVVFKVDLIKKLQFNLYLN